MLENNFSEYFEYDNKLYQYNDTIYSKRKVSLCLYSYENDKIIIKFRNVDRMTRNDIINYQNEVNILSTLNHDNIIKLLKYGKTEHYYYCIYPYYLNGNLEKYISENKLTYRQKLCYSKQLLNILDYLSNDNILHSDIKPENILISDDESKIILIDFEFSKIINNEYDKHHGGTPLFASPEIMQRKSYNLSADIWSFGVLTYYMFTNDYPYPRYNSKGKEYTNIGYTHNLLNLSWKYHDKIPLEFNYIYNCIFVLDYKNRITANQMLEYSLFANLDF